MNFKKNLKRFMTLDRHHAEGFTLVELIVVIAILAILGGVAVPAYSGYIEKTNKTADQTLVAEIEHALTLAYYEGNLSEGSAGYLMLSPNEGESFDDQGNTVADYSLGGPVAEAMEKYFGSNWMDFMQLKYGSWDVKNMMLSYEDAQAVVGSDFMKYSPNELMSQVQTLTDAVRKIDGALDDKEQLYEMYNYGSSNVLDDLAKEYYGEDASWGTITDEATKSNLLVLATASSINGNPTAASDAISEYANYAAYAAVDPTFGAAYDTFVADVSKATDMQSAKDAYSALVTASKGTDYDNWVKTAGNNTTAFNSIMAGVGNAMKDNGDAIIADLGNADMFTSGIGNEMFNDYLASAYAMAAGPEAMMDLDMSAFPGAVLVQYAVVDGVFYFANSMPIF